MASSTQFVEVSVHSQLVPKQGTGTGQRRDSPQQDRKKAAGAGLSLLFGAATHSLNGASVFNKSTPRIMLIPIRELK